MSKKYLGRGASLNPHNRFLKQEHSRVHEEGIDLPPLDHSVKTSFIEVSPKTIVNPVKSPDVGMDYSLNPYQGCEHGCAYCYARNSHEYWGYSAGVDFETKIMVKRNAAELLAKKFESKNWKVKPISLSGNTDCYQPVEKKLKITRSLLEVFLRYKHPVGLISKNALLLRDLDILKELNSMGLVKVYLSITTLDEGLRRVLEPRTSTISKRLKAVEQLIREGIPTGVMMAPIIPGLNSHEILPLAKAVSEAGAQRLGYTAVRLNGQIKGIFAEWVERHFPDRSSKVLGQIAEMHAGKLNDSEFGRRMKGEGRIAEMIRESMQLARNRYNLEKELPKLRCDLFERPERGQLSLWA
jgi:DNA repair photolyase